MCSQAETRVKCHCRIQMKNYQRIKWNPSKHNVLQFVVFYSNSETFEFHLQPGPKQRQTCMLHFRHSFLALLFFNFFFLSQFLKWIQKNKKSSFVSNPSNLPIACRLSSQTPAYIQTLLSDLPHNMSWSLHLQHLFVKPRAWARTRGSVQERYTSFHSQEENPHGSYPFLSALPSVGKLFERVIAPDLNIYTCFSFCYGCQAQGSDYTSACWIS